MTAVRHRMQQAIEEGVLRQAVIADREGFPITSAGSAFQPEELSAGMFLIYSSIERLERSLFSDLVSTFELRLREGKIVVGARPFALEEDLFILIMVLPPGAGYRVLSQELISLFKQTRGE